MTRRLLDIAMVCTLLLVLLTACQAEEGTPVASEAESRSATQTATAYLGNLASLAATAASIDGPGIGLLISTATSSTAGESAATTSQILNTPQPSVEPLSTQPDPAQVSSLQPVRFADCNRVEFVRDITTPDDTIISPGSPFEKTWRFKNAGSCAWTPAYRLVFVDGAQMAGQSFNLPGSVAPGEAINLTASLVAPQEAGSHRGLWMFEGPHGRFGMGLNAQEAFWVKIQVPIPAVSVSPPVPLPSINLAQEICTAQWQTSLGTVPCPADSNSPNGFAVVLDHPDLETRLENELAIYTHPPLEENSWIAGTYPLFTVKPGDRFLADIGCLKNFPDCQVEFQLAYAPTGGQPVTIGKWQEQNDQNITRLDIDLSGLAGQTIQLILSVYSRGDSGQAGAFWLVPQVQR